MSKPDSNRQPLREVHNVQPTEAPAAKANAPAGTAPLKPTQPRMYSVVKDRSMIQKKSKSGIPFPPRKTANASTKAATKASDTDQALKKPESASNPAMRAKKASDSSAAPNRPGVAARHSAKAKPHVSTANPSVTRANSIYNRTHSHEQVDRAQLQSLGMRRRQTSVTTGVRQNNRNAHVTFTGAPGARASVAMSSSRAQAPIQYALDELRQTRSLLMDQMMSYDQSRGTAENEELKREISVLREQVSRLLEHNRATENANAVKEKSSDSANSDLAKHLFAENTLLKHAKEDAENRFQAAQAELNTTHCKYEEARQELHRLQMMLDDNRTKLQKMTLLEEELDSIRADAHRVAEVETKLKKMTQLELECESVKRELDNAKCEIEHKEKKLLNSQRDVTKAQLENEDMTKAVDEITKERNFARKRIAQLEQYGNDKDEQNAALNGAVKHQESRIARVSAEKIALTAQVETAREDAQNVRDELSAMTSEKERLSKENDDLQAQAREDAKHRRKLHNMIQELKGNIRVFCRVRPPTEKEKVAADKQQDNLFDYTEKGQGVVARAPSLSGNDGSSALNAGKKYNFKFDKVFDPASTQSGVFEEISELVQSALDGYRVCIFAYGQTGSGKTYTMLGAPGTINNEGLGMIPRAVRQVFESAKAMERDDWSFTLQACFLEIYNETVRDLLDPNATSSGNANGIASSGSKANGNGNGKDYRITFDHETKLCTVSDVTVVDVRDENQLQRLIERSMKNRTTAATKANDRSSRSHSVFRLRIIGRNSATGQQLDGLLNLIDLAGSERLAHSKAEGERLRETRNINRSLSALGDVIAVLANKDSNKDKHVPFRNSKLTHLLQDSLGGDCKTLMFVNVSHAPESFNESLCSLRFAAKVNSCHVGTAQRSSKIDI